MISGTLGGLRKLETEGFTGISRLWLRERTVVHGQKDDNRADPQVFSRSWNLRCRQLCTQFRALGVQRSVKVTCCYRRRLKEFRLIQLHIILPMHTYTASNTFGAFVCASTTYMY